MTESIDDIEREIRKGLRGIDGPWLTFKHWVRGHRWFLIALIAIAFILLSSVAVNAAGVWRPHILVFISTDHVPMHQMNIPAERTFPEKSDCLQFVKDHPVDVKAFLPELLGLSESEIVHQVATCLLDETGQGI